MSAVLTAAALAALAIFLILSEYVNEVVSSGDNAKASLSMSIMQSSDLAFCFM
jgi:hypothetical protein